MKALLICVSYVVILTLNILYAPLFAQDETTQKPPLDIVLAIDVSSSMKVEDVVPTRLEAVKSAAQQLMSVHPTARYGIVLFAGEAIVYAPLATNDSLDFFQLLEQITIDLVEGTGTVIGEALDVSIKEFERVGSTNRKIIIFTDGATSESRDIFMGALHLTVKRKVEVYAVGVGRQGESTITTPDQQVVTIKSPYNDASLKTISNYTKGKYFHAESFEQMAKVAEEISLLLNIQETQKDE